jgi:hypothetical protein
MGRRRTGWIAGWIRGEGYEKAGNIRNRMGGDLVDVSVVREWKSDHPPNIPTDMFFLVRSLLEVSDGRGSSR